MLVIHCSATPSGQWLGGAPSTPRYVAAPFLIDKWHAKRGFKRSQAARKRLNWLYSAIGYHYVVDLDGDVHSGRHPAEVGAHAQGFNAHSLGICLVGGAEPEARYTAAQWRALPDLVRRLCAEHAMFPARPHDPRALGATGVVGHRDLSPDADGDGRINRRDWLKTCPGFDVGAWLLRGMQPLPTQVCAMPGGEA